MRDALIWPRIKWHCLHINLLCYSLNVDNSQYKFQCNLPHVWIDAKPYCFTHNFCNNNTGNQLNMKHTDVWNDEGKPVIKQTVTVCVTQLWNTVLVKEQKRTCYTIQLMRYSHFKTQSFQHIKPIKC